jgi:hypothetical protein
MRDMLPLCLHNWTIEIYSYSVILGIFQDSRTSHEVLLILLWNINFRIDVFIDTERHMDADRM